MDLTIFGGGAQLSQEPLTIDAASLYSAFEQVKDGRKAKGKRYPLSLILTLLMLGKLAGERSISGIREWVKERESLLKRQLNWPKGFPVNSTYSEALAQCSGKEVAQVIAQVILKARAVEQCGTEPSRLLAQRQDGENLIHTQWMAKRCEGRWDTRKNISPPCISCRSMSAKVGSS